MDLCAISLKLYAALNFCSSFCPEQDQLTLHVFIFLFQNQKFDGVLSEKSMQRI